MNKKALIELVNISVEFMSFSCNNQYYDQKDGLFIGSPTSSDISRIIYTKSWGNSCLQNDK